MILVDIYITSILCSKQYDIPFFLEGVNESTMNDDQLKKKIAEANKFMRHELSHNTKNPPSTQKSGYKSLLSVVDPASMDNKQDDNESILSHAHSSPGTIRNVFNVCNHLKLIINVFFVILF